MGILEKHERLPGPLTWGGPRASSRRGPELGSEPALRAFCTVHTTDDLSGRPLVQNLFSMAASSSPSFLAEFVVGLRSERLPSTTNSFHQMLGAYELRVLDEGSAYGAKSQAEFRSTALTRARCTAVSSIRHVDGPSPHVMGWMQHPFRHSSASRTPISELRVLDTHATEPASD